MKTKIFVFCNTQCGNRGDWHSIVAVSEAGKCIAGHVCSHHGFAQGDMGFTGTQKHDLYNAAHPGGWELVWVDNPAPGESPELDAAFAKAAAEAKP